MTVAVMQPPQRKGATEEILETIGKGLMIAQAYYGLKTDMAKFDDYKSNQDLTKKALEGDAAATEQLRKRANLTADDRMTSKERTELLGKGWRTAGESDAGALAFDMKDGSKSFLLPPAPEQKASEYRDVDVYDPRAGQNIKISVAKNQPLPTGYLAPKKDSDSPKKPVQVPGVGEVKDEKTAKEINDSIEKYANLKAGISKMLGVRDEAGFGGFEVLDRSLVKKGTQTSQDVKFQYKDLAKLGVLSEQDAVALANIVPDDPTAFGSSVKNQMVELGKLTDVKMANGLYQKGIPVDKIVALTGELPTLVTQGMTAAEQIALREIMAEQNRMGSR